MTPMTKITIEWETDNEIVPELPSQLEIPENLIERALKDDTALCNYLSDQYGYLVSNWFVEGSLERIPEEPEPELHYTDLMEKHELQGKKIYSIEGLSKDSEEVRITFTDGTGIRMYHSQDCCERVWLEDCEDADPKDFVGATLVQFEEASNSGPSNCGIQEWTFYNIRTTKADVSLRWCGESNGYYSTSVDVIKI